jgi:hypothetical protein
MDQRYKRIDDYQRARSELAGLNPSRADLLIDLGAPKSCRRACLGNGARDALSERNTGAHLVCLAFTYSNADALVRTDAMIRETPTWFKGGIIKISGGF